MTRLLVGGRWYDQVAPTALYEADFERVVLQQGSLLYPDYHLIPYKVRVCSDQGVAMPDAALIAKDYRAWWIVEVEMAHHSLHRHVLPQVETLAHGYYDQTHVDYVCQQMPCLDPGRARDVIIGKPPRVLVIVNSPAEEWVQPLRLYNALLAVVEVFRSDTNQVIFRVNGEHPGPLTEVISECYIDQMLPSFLVVEAPGALGVKHSETLTIRYNGCITEWKRLDAQERVWLIPVIANPLTAGRRYELLRQEGGELVVRPRA